MDSEHRHELKQNELAEGLAHLPQLIKTYKNQVIGAALIIIALVTAPMLSRMSQEKNIAAESELTQSIQLINADLGNLYSVTQDPESVPEAQSDAANTLAVNVDALLDKANGSDNPDLAALARIKAAQAIRTELLIRTDDADSETLQMQINKAKDAYQKALDGAADPALKAMATLGLGLCAEELGQTDEAKTLYQSIVNDETYAATVFPQQAQDRIAALADNAEVFTFVVAPEVEEAPAIPTQLPAELQQIEPAVEAAKEAAETPTEPQPEGTEK